jgi:hypothetical protein
MPKQKLPKSLLLIVITITILFTFACLIGGLKSQIIGRWGEASGSGLTLEFYENGTVTATILGMTATGDYACLDTDTIRIDLTGLAGSILGAQTFDVAIDGDTMILSSSNVNVQFVRLK